MIKPEQAAKIVITGPTASGKSTVGRMLAEHFQIEFIEEEWQDNPYLEAFSKGLSSFLQAELWFIQRDFDRYARAFDLVENQNKGVVLDKPFYENYTYVAIAPLTDPERKMCREMLDDLSGQITKPDALIDVQASTDLILQRIKSRGRAVEQSLTREWFDSFALAHLAEKEKWPAIPTVDVVADERDFLAQPEELTLLESQVCLLLQRS
jgi:deoxyguanosine kinase